MHGIDFANANIFSVMEKSEKKYKPKNLYIIYYNLVYILQISYGLILNLEWLYNYKF